MYYRRWTRMHFKPGMKYFVKYGVINPKFDKYTHLMQQQNPGPIHHRLNNPKKHSELDIDTKLINNLFLKYPDLKYEPISKAKYPGQEFNTFSYAYAFINQQKKMIRQGYTMSKAFQLTQAKYHQKMQRKLDQSLLSRGLAFGNRARSFLNVYQQQAELESRYKTQRSQRQLQKYQLKLKNIRQTVDSHDGSEAFLTEDVLKYQRGFFTIKQHNRDIDSNSAMAPVDFTQIQKTDSQQRTDFINSVQAKFKNLFNQFYEHAATKDKLEGLTDEEIINQIQTSPSKIKRQMRELIRYFESRNIKMSLQSGRVVVSGPNSDIITNDIKNNKYLKIALLSETLNYQKPIYSTIQNATKNSDQVNDIFRHKSLLKDNRTESLTKQQKDIIRQNKKKDLTLVADDYIYFNKQAYKIFQTQQERMLRLQVKYYQMLISEIDTGKNSQKAQGQDLDTLKQLQNKREQAIKDFRRLKYRLERRYQNISTDQLLFAEHQQLGKGIKFESEIQYEELVGHLRKKSQDRRLTSLDQSKDNKISANIRVLEVSQGAIAEGTVISRSQ